MIAVSMSLKVLIFEPRVLWTAVGSPEEGGSKAHVQLIGILSNCVSREVLPRESSVQLQI